VQQPPHLRPEAFLEQQAKDRRQSDRAAMRELISGNGDALDDLVQAVAVAVVPDEHPSADQRMGHLAHVAEAAVLDGLVYAARAAGWRPS
jgi:hypothetical protein